jgi:hypothetical protein
LTEQPSTLDCYDGYSSSPGRRPPSVSLLGQRDNLDRLPLNERIGSGKHHQLAGIKA